MGNSFVARHIGPREVDVEAMLKLLKLSSLDELVEKTVPKEILRKDLLALSEPLDESEAIAHIESIAKKNKVFRSFIGMGFSPCLVPSVIKRNILENPGWYTQYTPYQAEISQGRLEALINFQTLVSDLTGLPIANASMLDEASAAAEAMTFCYRLKGGEGREKFFVSKFCHPHVIAVVETRAEPLNIELVIDDEQAIALDGSFFGALVSYPRTDGSIVSYESFSKRVHDAGALLVADADLMSLCLLTPPGEWGADVAIGTTQRFGVPLGFGGPHAAYFVTKDEYKREIPGRIVGVSKDARGNVAYRLALQTREQHIRRERATSNICTAQVLLAVMASMYAVYHGPEGLKKIASSIAEKATRLSKKCREKGLKINSEVFFDTFCIDCDKQTQAQIQKRALSQNINLRYFDDGRVSVALDEATTEAELQTLSSVLCGEGLEHVSSSENVIKKTKFSRSSQFLTHPVYSKYQSETELLRYIHRLQAKDLSLTASMIPLGSCTMKLNATTEMEPVTWGAFSQMHPFSPVEQAEGYVELITELEKDLCEITGFSAMSLQPNAGSQGEYAGLLCIRKYHIDRGEAQRNICLIPQSAHGTNPATASMVGMDVVVVACDDKGNIDVSDLERKAKEHSEKLAALMITYPSTHGVFEAGVKKICEIIHQHGGQVYMDGANMNAQVGLCRPADIGADVCHLNLHKTFCIPHGGGGPGVGPIGVKAHLAPFIPGHPLVNVGGKKPIGPVAAAPWGSAGILMIPFLYIKMMGALGLKRATEIAILNANYIAARLEPYFPVLYRGENGMVAHECILDLRNFKRTIGIEVADVAKRLMDYGFHAPTVSFPVVETLMIEPTESESKEELDRFCDAMIAIRNELSEIELGKADKVNNVLKNAPHTAAVVSEDEWVYPYSRKKACYPVLSLENNKFWPPVSRIDNAYGDRNLFCACVPVEGFEK